eukprot:NODE_17454_length_941_cov_7.590909.p1 GENE.NODE_17454_length_941_cov_7.590909~~NODE_17454_length_941_cov_7.590909.p1  ORF type:complete len:194 (+),score=26.21 NODE_17454_length_941_cov_7.590909:271-852(+)
MDTNESQAYAVARAGNTMPLDDCDRDREYVVVINNPSEIGLDVKRRNDGFLVVQDLKEGPISVWNRNNPDYQVQKLDTIVAVNDRRSVSGILDELRKVGHTRMLMQRPLHSRIRLNKQGQRIGLQLKVRRSHGREIVVETVETGFISDWNRRNPDKPVKPGDRLIGVNGVRDDPALMLERIDDDYVELVIDHG